jgi:nitrogen fixation protein NifQ
MSVTYSDTIRRWAADDRRAGTLPDADGTGEVGLGAGETGRRLAVRFALRVHDTRVEMVRYQVFGCGFTIAACAAAAELAEGHTLSEVAAIAPSRVDAALAGLPPERDYCAVLAVEALQAAVRSVSTDKHPVHVGIHPEEDNGDTPRLSASNPVYRLLIDSPLPPGAPPQERHLFACLLAVAASEASNIATVLGLSNEELNDLLHLYFPAISLEMLKPLDASPSGSGTRGDPDILELLLTHLSRDADGWTPAPSLWLARILAARATRPGHLWIAMGLFCRKELTDAITRHLPSLAEANHQGMRWKRFLFKQLCEQSGGRMCKAPDCRVCSDYALCFEGDPNSALELNR